MPEIQNEAYFVGASTLELGTDGYTTAISGFKVQPTVPSVTFKDINSGVQVFTGAPEWVCTLDYAQDWKTPNSLSKKLRDSYGQLLPMKITPDDGSDVCDIVVRVVPGGFGGKGGSVAEDTVQLPVNGQPAWTPAV